METIIGMILMIAAGAGAVMAYGRWPARKEHEAFPELARRALRDAGTIAITSAVLAAIALILACH